MTTSAELERVSVILGDRGLLDAELMERFSPAEIVGICERWARRVGIVARGASAVGIATGRAYPGLWERLIARTEVELRYHVPRSQVWQGSRGRASGHVHLHVLEPLDSGRLHRSRGRALCGRDGWYERPPDESEAGDLCPRCVSLAERHGLSIPTETATPA